MGFLWSAFALKLPLIVLILAVWWAIREEPEDPTAQDDDGGIRKPDDHHHPLKPFPRHPRRGPHGGAGGDRFPSPARVRSVTARARTYGH
jgi:hypothetical protein